MVAKEQEKARKGESPAVESLRQERAADKRRHDDGELDEGLEDTFPASDPVSVTNPSQSGDRKD